LFCFELLQVSDNLDVLNELCLVVGGRVEKEVSSREYPDERKALHNTLLRHRIVVTCDRPGGGAGRMEFVVGGKKLFVSCSLLPIYKLSDKNKPYVAFWDRQILTVLRRKMKEKSG
jgi:hypothetical protein